MLPCFLFSPFCFHLWLESCPRFPLNHTWVGSQTGPSGKSGKWSSCPPPRCPRTPAAPSGSGTEPSQHSQVTFSIAHQVTNMAVQRVNSRNHNMAGLKVKRDLFHCMTIQIKSNQNICWGSSYRVGISQVPESSFLAHELPVHHHRKVDIQDTVVIDGQTENNADQRVLSLIFKRWWVEPKQFGALIVCEHACRRKRWQQESVNISLSPRVCLLTFIISRMFYRVAQNTSDFVLTAAGVEGACCINVGSLTKQTKPTWYWMTSHHRGELYKLNTKAQEGL